MKSRLVCLLLPLALLAGACGGGGDNTKVDDGLGRLQGGTTAPSVGADTSSTTSGSVAAGPTTTTVKGTATTAKKSGSSPTTAAAGGGGGSAFVTVPGPAKQGTYNYSQQGTSPDGPVPANGTLVVKGAGPAQTFSRYFDPAKPPQDLHYSFKADGPYLTGVTIRAKGVTITCTFAAPIPAPPWPPTIGKSSSGQGTCSNGITIEYSGHITAHQPTQVAGKTYDTVVINSVISIHGAVEATINDTEWFAPALSVPAYTRQVINGTSPLGPITGDVTGKLTSIP